MTWDGLFLVILIIGLGVYTVYMSMWAEEERLRFRHFMLQIILFGFALAQALSL